jgi:hypothetical protein
MPGGKIMSIKEMLGQFAGEGETLENGADPEPARVQAEIEALMVRLNQCFVDIILPGVFEVENDMNQAGYWNLLNVGQSTSLSSGKPNIKRVSLVFYPEKIGASTDEARVRDSAYKALISASGDLRSVDFRIEFPKRIPPVTEVNEERCHVEGVTSGTVNAFLESFVMGALDAYASDRVLR